VAAKWTVGHRKDDMADAVRLAHLRRRANSGSMIAWPPVSNAVASPEKRARFFYYDGFEVLTVRKRRETLDHKR
jgi:hypothetical protein